MHHSGFIGEKTLEISNTLFCLGQPGSPTAPPHRPFEQMNDHIT